MDTTNIFVERNFSNGSSPAIQQTMSFSEKGFAKEQA